MKVDKSVYKKLLKDLTGRGLGVESQSSNSQNSPGTANLFRFDQLLHQHQTGVAARLDDSIDEQITLKKNS
jgi:hypothetical protein